MDKHQPLIDAYCAAYQAANGYPVTAHIEYQRGWFVFGQRFDNGAIGVQCRYRRADLERMTQRLNDRAAIMGGKHD